MIFQKCDALWFAALDGAISFLELERPLVSSILKAVKNMAILYHLEDSERYRDALLRSLFKSRISISHQPSYESDYDR